MKSVFARLAQITFTIAIVMFAACTTASAQTTTLKSRLAVVANDTKTSIWVSNFPKQTSVVISDADNNLLSIVSTNDFGAAFITLPAGIKTNITAKTINGEITVSNKAVVKSKTEEANVAAAEPEPSDKA